MIQVRLFCEHINDDKTYSLGLTYMTINDGYGALISHTFSNIKSLKIMKDIFMLHDFHSYEVEEKSEEDEE
jgi:hypothetical protein